MQQKPNPGDIDIDVVDRMAVLDIVDHVPASSIRDGDIRPHNTGVYVQNITVDPVTGMSSVDYRYAEELGYHKIDFLNMGAYNGVRDEGHLKRLISTEPDWTLFQVREIVETLYQIHDHFDIIQRMPPHSIEQLAMLLAIIRPGKRYLLGRPWSEVEKYVWLKDEKEGYSFKKSHAIAYATCIVVQLNLLVEQSGEHQPTPCS